jgi:hypothetical protein
MKEKQIDLQTAANEVGKHFRNFMERFMADKARLPSWGPAVDADVARYVDALSHWVYGNLHWSFETQRYFGVAHQEIKRTRLVALRPQRLDEEETPP